MPRERATAFGALPVGASAEKVTDGAADPDRHQLPLTASQPWNITGETVTARFGIGFYQEMTKAIGAPASK